MRTLYRSLLISLGLGLVTVAIIPVAEAQVACYHCECAKCVQFPQGFDCHYVLENKGCDCVLSGCTVNPSYCDSCSYYPWPNSCQLMACRATDGTQEACSTTPDLGGIQILQEDDAGAWLTQRTVRSSGAGSSWNEAAGALDDSQP